ATKGHVRCSPALRGSSLALLTPQGAGIMVFFRAKQQRKHRMVIVANMFREFAEMMPTTAAT
ncbi:hypothetical protein, partial [Gordonia sp. 4N]|uniref:hypothetical protein n=1 Tax=Gordonia sp. 4N TaxID=2993508 RepID=UPI002248835F